MHRHKALFFMPRAPLSIARAGAESTGTDPNFPKRKGPISVSRAGAPSRTGASPHADAGQAPALPPPVRPCAPAAGRSHPLGAPRLDAAIIHGRGFAMVAALVLLLAPFAQGSVAEMHRYDVIWREPGAGPKDSMPLGNGDVGINLWTERSGDVAFYISKTDAWSGNTRLLKLGRIRLRFSPPLDFSNDFTQRLNVADGTIEIAARTAGGAPARLTIWVDAEQPAIRVLADCEEPVSAELILELWRTAERRLEGPELFSAYGFRQAPFPIIVRPDNVLTGHADRLIWYHRNRHSLWRETLEMQDLGDWADSHPDPLLGLTFGGCIMGDDFVRAGRMAMASKHPAKRHYGIIVVTTTLSETIQGWLQALEAAVRRAKAVPPEESLQRTRRWWHQFWGRSFFHLYGAEDAEVVSRGYNLQRFMNACAGRGRYPIKFNGSIFTVDAEVDSHRFDADYRRWGGPYWFQNTRLAYWPMLPAGDFEMMQPLFGMYLDALPLAAHRTRVYFGHGGAYFPETMFFFGAYAPDNYGWDRRGKKPGFVVNTYIRNYFSCNLELLALALAYYDYTGDDEFLRSVVLPFADAFLTFYEEHFPRDEAGRLLLEPCQALETYQKAVNSLPDIAGLKYVLELLLNRAAGAARPEQVEQWKRLLAILPPLPMAQAEDGEILAGAEKILEPPRNIENPELYAVFPYRLYGVGLPDLEMARRTYRHRRIKGNRGWQQDPIDAALLGLADEARAMLAERFAQVAPGFRFPAFWGPNFDWIPDQDHGCVGMIALQFMLLQAVGRKIYLLPAWPRGWDAHFRLHAPFGTVVEGRVEGGELRELKVEPAERRADVVICQAQ